MNAFFGDTFYFLALLNRNDNAHARCKSFASTLDRRLITTEWILNEVADGLAGSRHRGMFKITRNTLLGNSEVTIIPFEMSLYEAAIGLYSSKPDKKWSLTDCTSFVVMTRQRITEALTADIHFEQAGFVALFK